MIAIVVVGYNRPKQTERLLKSVVNADYGNDQVDLIISIDKGNLQDDVRKVADSVDWTHGRKRIRCFSERIGLRIHILKCGDFAFEYEGVVILEDDLVVSPGFYIYTKQSLEFCKSDARIAGISLYSHLFLTSIQRVFCPEWSGFDTYLMQYAQSWGQCWSSEMWQAFRSWYDKNKDSPFEDEHIPRNVRLWKSSWLKYQIKYVIENNLYYLYPYHSLTTNFSEAGEHSKYSSASYQVPMFRGGKTYSFPPYEQSVKYDAFWERVDIQGRIPFAQDKLVCMDLYGYKTDYAGCDYLISTVSKPYKVVREIALTYRPHEINCFEPEPGAGIYIYDLHTIDEAPKYNPKLIAKYEMRDLSFKQTWIFTIEEFLKALKIKLGLMLKKRMM